MQVKVVNYKRV